eukprot:11051141-Ditylum_brightwellii.AAC.1
MGCEGGVVPNAANPEFDEVIRGEKNDFQSRMISKQLQEDDSSLNNRMIRHLNGTLTDLKEEIANGRKFIKKEDLKTGESKLSKLKIRMIKKMSSIDGLDHVDDLTEMMTDFLE